MEADIADDEAGRVVVGPRAQLRAGCHAFLDTIAAAPAVRVLLIDAPAVLGWEQWRRLDAENPVVHLREALSDVGVPAGLLVAPVAQLSGAMNEAALWIAQQPRGGEAGAGRRAPGARQGARGRRRLTCGGGAPASGRRPHVLITW